MPRRSILSASERGNLLALPDSGDDLIRRYTFSESDFHRSATARRGQPAGICRAALLPPLSRHRAGRESASAACVAPSGRRPTSDPVERWAEYGERAQTRREHLVELQTVFGFEPFTRGHHRLAVQELMETAMQTDKGNRARDCAC